MKKHVRKLERSLGRETLEYDILKQLLSWNAKNRTRFYFHLKECEFRFNYRHDDIYKILLKMLRENPSLLVMTLKLIVILMSLDFYPQLIAVEALELYLLRTYWNTGEILDVDVGEILKSIKSLAPILNVDNFKKAHICDHRQCVEWFDTEFGADNVYAWAMEQQGQPSHEMFYVWLYRNRLSNAEAAKILGISKRMVEWYATARKKIPWHVWLACLGYEVLIHGQKSGAVNDMDVKIAMIETSLKMYPVR